MTLVHALGTLRHGTLVIGGMSVMLAGLLVGVSVLGTCASPRASQPVRHGLHANPVALTSGDGAGIRGWFVRGRPRAGAVLLLHGVGASRVDMLARARFLAAAGYSLLLVDFRGHGESCASQTTYGSLESWDVRAALGYLRATLPGERIGVVGISMGGAAALLGPSPAPVDALVLESVYPTIQDAVRNRLVAWLGWIGRALAPIAIKTLFPRAGVAPRDLRPIDRIHEQIAPVFILAGTADRYTTIEESRSLFERARAPKALWEVEGAAHSDLHAYARGEYEHRVLRFLTRYLRADAGAVPAARRVAELQVGARP